MVKKLAACCVAFFGCATPATVTPPKPAATTARAPVAETEPPAAEVELPASVIAFVRHAEKAVDGTKDPPLNEAGVRRANCLADVLEPFAPTALWATEYTRTQSTLAALAERTGRTVEVFPAGDATGWESRLSGVAPGSHVVASGHSNTIPAMVTALGGDPGALDEHGNIDHDEYDRIVFVVLDATGTHVATLVQRFCVVTRPEASAAASRT